MSQSTKYRRFVKTTGHGFEFFEVFFRDDQTDMIDAIQDYGYREAAGLTAIYSKPEPSLCMPGSERIR